MKHPSFDATCGVCRSLYGDEPAESLYEDDLWSVRPAHPAGVPG